jgi:hypothetical protein
MPLSEYAKEWKNDYEKLIEMEQTSQLTWAILILTSGLGFITLHIEIKALPNANLIVFIFGVLVIGIFDFCFYRIVVGFARIATYIECLKPISRVYRKEFKSTTIFTKLYNLFVKVDRRKIEPRRWITALTIALVDSFLILYLIFQFL